MEPLPPPVDHTITQFLGNYRQYLQSGRLFEAARFALTGRTHHNTGYSVINTIRDKLGNTAEELPYIRRDFDSLIGFTRRIPVLSDLSYYPNPSLNRTLTHSIHVKHTMKTQNREVCVLVNSFIFNHL
jgi:hypothetical protein